LCRVVVGVVVVDGAGKAWMGKAGGSGIFIMVGISVA
jgi:hypothetical protein